MEVYEVSVIIPVWNAERWLDECLRSLYLQDFDRSLQVLDHFRYYLNCPILLVRLDLLDELSTFELLISIDIFD